MREFTFNKKTFFYGYFIWLLLLICILLPPCIFSTYLEIQQQTVEALSICCFFYVCTLFLIYLAGIMFYYFLLHKDSVVGIDFEKKTITVTYPRKEIMIVLPFRDIRDIVWMRNYKYEYNIVTIRLNNGKTLMLEFFDELYKAVTNDELCFPFETKEIIWGWMTITVNLSKFSEYAKPCPEGRILE